MKWITAAEGPIQDYVHVLVDEIPYCVHHKRAEIHYEGTDPSALHLLMTNDKHRRNLAERASLVHKECGGWTQQREDSWNVHCGGKNVKVLWDGSMGKKAAATRKASPETNDLAMQMYGRPLAELQPEEIEALVEQMRSKMQPQTQQPSAPMSPAMAPLAPGQASVRWTAAADENPFAKKDDEKKDDSKDEKKDDKSDKGDKKAPPFGKKDDKEKGKDEKDSKDDKPKEKKDSKPAPKKDAPKKESPKKDKSPEPKDPKEKGDIKDAEKAIDLVEKLLEKEDAEGEPHAEELKRCLDILKRFVGEEAAEEPMGDSMMPGAPKPPMPPPLKLDLKPMMPPPPGSTGPAMPLGPKMMSWTDENNTGFRESDLVWRKADVDGPHGVGLEPGRVVAIGNGMVVVDWGDMDGIPAEERPADLVLAERAEGETELFAFTGGSTILVEEEVPEASQEELRHEVEAILAKTSLKDILTKESSEGADDNKIVHLSTGSIGEVVAKASDGRILARFDGKEVFVWPYEVRRSNQEE